MSWVISDVERIWFGYSLPVDEAESDVTVGITAIRLVGVNARRAKVQFSNFGGSTIVIGTSAAVTAAKGIPIAPGLTGEFDWQTDYDRVIEEFWAISAAAGNAVHVTETITTGADDQED